MPMKRVCLACGKVEGEHRGWDISCELNSQEFDDETHHFQRDEHDRVVAVTPPLPFEDRMLDELNTEVEGYLKDDVPDVHDDPSWSEESYRRFYGDPED
jgi:hypothetical protein